MLLTCPCCGTKGYAVLFAADADARHCVQLTAKLPPALERSLFAYLALFQPKQRVLTWKRIRTLLNELLPAIERELVERNGRPWPAPNAAWISAFDEMVAKRDKLTLPLKSNGYLFAILAGTANQQEAQAEEAHEQQRRRGNTTESTETPQPRINRAAIRSHVAGENQVRARMGKPPMSPEDEAAFLAQLGCTQS